MRACMGLRMEDLVRAIYPGWTRAELVMTERVEVAKPERKGYKNLRKKYRKAVRVVFKINQKLVYRKKKVPSEPLPPHIPWTETLAVLGIDESISDSESDSESEEDKGKSGEDGSSESESDNEKSGKNGKDSDVDSDSESDNKESSGSDSDSSNNESDSKGRKPKRRKVDGVAKRGIFLGKDKKKEEKKERLRLKRNNKLKEERTIKKRAMRSRGMKLFNIYLWNVQGCILMEALLSSCDQFILIFLFSCNFIYYLFIYFTCFLTTVSFRERYRKTSQKRYFYCTL